MKITRYITSRGCGLLSQRIKFVMSVMAGTKLVHHSIVVIETDKQIGEAQFGA
jgi:hypothetical protein